MLWPTRRASGARRLALCSSIWSGILCAWKARSRPERELRSAPRRAPATPMPSPSCTTASIPRRTDSGLGSPPTSPTAWPSSCELWSTTPAPGGYGWQRWMAISRARSQSFAPPQPSPSCAGSCSPLRLDAEAAEAVLAASGHRTERRPTAPADLTPREVEVLRLIARGHSSAEAGRELGIKPRRSARTSSTSTPRSAPRTAPWRPSSQWSMGSSRAWSSLSSRTGRARRSSSRARPCAATGDRARAPRTTAARCRAGTRARSGLPAPRAAPGRTPGPPRWPRARRRSARSRPAR